jgi:HD-GYP domain-containing protein (c-di-GMP phosphodiesterase class II)
MKLLPIDDVRHMLHAGAALPWNVRDGGGKLLLARGHMVTDAVMATSLLERGMFVDADEVTRLGGSLETSKEREKEKDPGFAGRWSGMQAKLGTLLRASTESFFLEKLQEAIQHIGVMADRNTDLLIFSIVRHDHSRYAQYGSVHSLHVASLCGLMARRLNWTEAQRNSVIGAALTMNLSIIELQGRLAAQSVPLTPAQRKGIEAHPQASADMLRAGGLADEDWLKAVEQHHEHIGGGGYPGNIMEPTEMSQLVRFVDCFTAMHSARVGRPQQPAQQAARELYTRSKAHPLAAALIKEFGIFPPGCFVKLANGETAIVTRRGSNANTPIVAAIVNRNGDAFGNPSSRDTSVAANAIVSTVEAKSVLVHVPVEKLYDMRTTS